MVARQPKALVPRVANSRDLLVRGPVSTSCTVKADDSNSAESTNAGVDTETKGLNFVMHQVRLIQIALCARRD